MKQIFISDSPGETEKIASNLAQNALSRKYVCLTGELGAGKTAFTRGLVAALCPEKQNEVRSPTFSVVNEYAGEQTAVFHFDFYRLRDEDDLISTGFYDYETRKGVIVAEWGELFPEVFPEDALFIEITPEGETKRRITVSYKDKPCIF